METPRSSTAGGRWQTADSKQYPRTTHPPTTTAVPVQIDARREARNAMPQANHRPRDRTVSLTENLPRVGIHLPVPSGESLERLRRHRARQPSPTLLISARSVWVDGVGRGMLPNPWCASAISRPLPSRVCQEVACPLANSPGQGYGCLSPRQRMLCPFVEGRVSRFHVRRIGLAGRHDCLVSCLSLVGRRRGISNIHRTAGDMLATGGDLRTVWRTSTGRRQHGAGAPPIHHSTRRLVKDRDLRSPAR